VEAGRGRVDGAAVVERNPVRPEHAQAADDRDAPAAVRHGIAVAARVDDAPVPGRPSGDDRLAVTPGRNHDGGRANGFGVGLEHEALTPGVHPPDVEAGADLEPREVGVCSRYATNSARATHRPQDRESGDPGRPESDGTVSMRGER
jgi:hypothetical protein